MLGSINRLYEQKKMKAVKKTSYDGIETSLDVAKRTKLNIIWPRGWDPSTGLPRKHSNGSNGHHKDIHSFVNVERKQLNGDHATSQKFLP